MATRKTGPVKPPILDLQARKTTPDKPKNQTARAKAGSTRAKPVASEKDNNTSSSSPKKPRGTKNTTDPNSAANAASAQATRQTTPATQKSMSLVLAATIGVVGGAVLGALLSVGLLVSGLLLPLLPQPLDPRFDELSTRVGLSEEQVTEGLVGFNALNDQVTSLRLSTEQAIATLSDQTDAGQAELQDRLTSLSASQTELENKIGQLENTPAPAPADSFDPGPLEAKIAALNTRLDAIAAGASTDDAQKLATNLDALRVKVDALAELQTRLSALETRFSSMQQTAEQADTLAKANADDLSRLTTKLEAQAAATPSAPVTPPSAQIPLALMGLDAALSQGQPFETQLQMLTSMVPDLTISPSLADFASKGLPAPDELARNIGAAMPALLAARPLSPDAGWQESLWARLKSLLALRPTSKNGAEGVDATIARLEIALSQRNFADANAAIKELPDPMRQTLGALAPQLEALQELQTLKSNITNAALRDGSTGEAPQ